jgi:hypothetical protein
LIVDSLRCQLATTTTTRTAITDHHSQITNQSTIQDHHSLIDLYEHHGHVIVLRGIARKAVDFAQDALAQRV